MLPRSTHSGASSSRFPRSQLSHPGRALDFASPATPVPPLSSTSSSSSSSSSTSTSSASNASSGHRRKQRRSSTPASPLSPEESPPRLAPPRLEDTSDRLLDDEKTNGTMIKLLHRVKQHLRRGSLPSAIFLADKLVTMSQGQPECAFLLARALFESRQYEQAFEVLMQYDTYRSSLEALLLAARCLERDGQWGECLTLLGEQPMLFEKRRLDELSKSSGQVASSLASSVDEDHDYVEEEEQFDIFLCEFSLIRARCYEAHENFELAQECYCNALRFDPYCWEAFDALVNRFLMSPQQVLLFMSTMKWNEMEDLWLMLTYKCTATLADGRIVSQQLERLESLNGLSKNKLVSGLRALKYLYDCDFEACYRAVKCVLQRESGYEVADASDIILVAYFSALVFLQYNSELFYISHKMLEDLPERPVSWYAVGAYYFSLGKYEDARKYFSKAAMMNSRFAAAWVGYGHAFAEQDESDQALTAYRTAYRLAPGNHLPSLFLGMEYARAGNHDVALAFLQSSSSRCPSDVAPLNEWGVVLYVSHEYEQAKEVLAKALSMSYTESEQLTRNGSVIALNLAHCYRKLGMYTEALELFSRCLVFAPSSVLLLSSLGITHHALGNLDKAILFYQQCLGVRPEHSLVNSLLARALEEQFSSSVCIAVDMISPQYRREVIDVSAHPSQPTVVPSHLVVENGIVPEGGIVLKPMEDV